MKMNKIEVLGKDEIELIHNKTLELLEKLGVKVESQEARKILQDNGANVNESTEYVKFPEELVLEQVKKVPNHFTLWGTDKSFSFEVNTKTVNFATVGTPVKIFDPTKKNGIRKSKLSDTINQIRIVDSLKNIMCSHVDVWPNDVPYLELHYHAIKAWATHSTKPYGLGCLGRVASQDMMDLTSTIVGGDEELVKYPRLIGFFNPVSPLTLNKLQLNGLFIFAKYKQPTIIAPAASAGSTAPVTLAGLLIQSNMETLSSITLTQLINPGCPVFYSTMNAPMDPATGNVAWGSIETGLITVGAAQMGRYYNIPTRGPGLVTDSKVLDLQNGFERFMTLFCSANAGINYITCAGTYESSLAEALELLVIDDELIEIVKRGFRGIRVDDESIAIDQISRVATEGKNYLMLKHTVKNTRKEIFVPKLVDRDRRGIWQRNGAKDIIARAREKVDEILQLQKGPGISQEIEEKLQNIYTKISSRAYDDFRKAEGLDDAVLPKELPNSED